MLPSGMTDGGAWRDDKRRVMDAVDIVRLIGEHVQLRKKGREWAGLCPFHDDRNPSMYVVPGKQIYHCFVCGAGGDALAFVMNYHKMSFREALEHLAERAGVTLTPWKPAHAAAGGGPDQPGAPELTRGRLAQASAQAARFYRTVLEHAEHGRQARALLEHRGVSAAMVERFALGAAPDRWDGLALTAQKQGWDTVALEAVGLIKPRQSGGGRFDLLRHRVVFPIHDALGRAVAFGGRRINDEDNPKYLNSPEHPLFNKSATLYALHQAGSAVRRQGWAVVVEGYMDAIACHQAGLENVVATLGTALNEAGARVLQRLCGRVVLLFDGDDAGARAADRAVEVLLGTNLDVSIATLSAARAAGEITAKDPDELLKTPGGLDALRRLLDRGVEALEYRFERLRQRAAGLGMSQRAAAMEEEIGRLVELGFAAMSPTKQSLVAQRVARVSGASEDAVRRSIRAAEADRARRARGRAQDPVSQGPQTPEPLPTRLREPHEHVLACLASLPTALDELRPDDLSFIAPERFSNATMGTLAAVVARIAQRAQRSQGPPTEELAGARSVADLLSDDEFADGRLQPAAVALIHQLHQWLGQSEPAAVRTHLRGCLEAARREEMMRRLRAGGDADGAGVERGAGGSGGGGGGGGVEGAVGPAAGGAGVAGVAGVAGRLQQLRAAHETGTKDPRTVPKPM